MQRQGLECSFLHYWSVTNSPVQLTSSLSLDELFLSLPGCTLRTRRPCFRSITCATAAHAKECRSRGLGGAYRGTSPVRCPRQHGFRNCGSMIGHRTLTSTPSCLPSRSCWWRALCDCVAA